MKYNTFTYQNILGVISIIIGGLLLVSCNTNQDETDSFLESFDSLTISTNTIMAGETAQLKAYTKGTNLNFEWETTAGDIIPSVDSATYLPHACSAGEQTITCTAQGANKEESKSVTIRVE
ncbi:MAG: hypothetical protein R6U95_08310 [Bacteroidales bacterium]